LAKGQRNKKSKASPTLNQDAVTSFEEIESVKLHEITESRYLNYALSVITSRALPDVRDGLKPVQRRILYAMYHDLKLRSDSRYLKSARVVGDVMGKYHPHGDQSIYDAMVRMSQSFSLRYPLVEGYGNFGSLDGDSAAAMRYTEARLAGPAEQLLHELNQDTIDRRANYDGQLEEPAVLPAQLPNLLINGATGIAVGMATHIPPHNLKEVITALLKLIRSPHSTDSDLCKIIKGPDFPTGGEILNTSESLVKIYAQGHGAIKVRGTYTIEKKDRTRLVIINSIPYEVQKGNLVEKIAQLVIDKKLPQIVDVRDESTDEIRVVLELKRGESHQATMAYLYKYTALQQNFNLNLTCLVPTHRNRVLKPERLGLKQCLQYFLDFRLEVVTRRLNHRLIQLQNAIHRLEAFEIIYKALDEAIQLIRKSDGKADAQARLQQRFGLDESQTQAILDMRLYRLAKLEIAQVQSELKDKRTKAKEHQLLLGDSDALWSLIKEELKQQRQRYADERKTLVVGPQEEAEFSAEAYIIKENTWLIVTRNGRVKRQRGFSELSAIRVPEGDEVGWALHSNTRNTATFYTQTGSAYTILVGDINLTTGYGDPLQALFKFDDGEKIVGVVIDDPALYPLVSLPQEAEPEDQTLEGIIEPEPIPKHLLPPFGIALTRFGRIHRFPLRSFSEVSQKGGRRYMTLENKDEIIACYGACGDESVALASRKGRAMIFSIHDIPLRQKSSKGCVAIKLMRGDTILGYKLVKHPMDGLLVTTGGGREKLIRESHQSSSKLRKTRRGGRGYEMIRRGNFEEWHNPPLLLQANNEEQTSKSNISQEESQEEPKEEVLNEVETDQDVNKGGK
jgi:DNA gyrase subunit A